MVRLRTAFGFRSDTGSVRCRVRHRGKFRSTKTFVSGLGARGRLDCGSGHCESLSQGQIYGPFEGQCERQN